MRKQNAFTLIELLVVIGVTFLLLASSVAGYSLFNQRQKLVSAGQQLKGILRDIQSRAYTGEMDCSTCNCSVDSDTPFYGWYVDLTDQTIFGRCGALEYPAGRQSMALSDKITIIPQITPETTGILYRSYPPGTDSSGILCISMENMSSYYRVNITRSGEVSDTGVLSDTCP